MKGGGSAQKHMPLYGEAMQCELLFYVAHKTGKNQDIFNKKLLSTDLKLTKVMVATSPLDFAEQLKGSLNRSNLVFIIGGLLRQDETNTVDILSKSIESIGKGKIECKRIDSPGGSSSGFIIQSGRQMIVMLPDDPEELNTISGPVLMKYISDFYGLRYIKLKDSRNDINFSAVNDVDSFLNSINERAGSYVSEEPAEISKMSKMGQKSTKVLLAILIGLGILATSFIVIYFLFHVVIQN